MFKTMNYIYVLNQTYICIKVDDTIEEEGNKEIDKIIVDCNRRKE